VEVRPRRSSLSETCSTGGHPSAVAPVDPAARPVPALARS